MGMQLWAAERVYKMKEKKERNLEEEKRNAKNIARILTCISIIAGVVIAWDMADFWVTLQVAGIIYYFLGAGATIGAYLTGPLSPALGYCMKIGYGATLGGWIVARALIFDFPETAGSIDIYIVGLIISSLVCIIIWNHKFVQLNYVSNEAVDKMMSLYRTFAPYDNGSEDDNK